ncbi:MEF2BNB [Lepeophtheirus salmonis]|uniref:MEF2BNB n=2 Tax=Lepeophtheirus salmonis TaxID=72036 RepID=A0A0K2TU51_LEPSM|nr:BLOC-1-related complex subunit 8 homolog [Lepeophtheirus salmonis]XP_040574808.1 BLOC-1-related complex subunit 8 homolog [Lepeophtheirus salmonis]XP_040574810.1 BLOC-1-related complex subunit 8 homolog [Lepeophtheirus salmonis]XP_040574811.1 BLOC-1-related complex subunit 8 homolog [Lepeophtheirus salmonis]CAB4068795.1 MEF2BNB [Lepeophtheirus salmonis]CAF3015934.1 MEF2BNB [Lepeophtheirus salmonis]
MASESPISEIKAYETDQELETRVKKVGERISENLHICANEPSLALYRLAEHVKKTLPPTVESRKRVRILRSELQGAYFDADYSLQVIHSMDKASSYLTQTQELLKNSIFLVQQIKYERTRRPRQREQSMYQRFSAHLTSVDLSDLKETARETASRVESALQRTTSSSSAGSTGDPGTSVLNRGSSSSSN